MTAFYKTDSLRTPSPATSPSRQLTSLPHLVSPPSLQAGTMCEFVFLNELGREGMWANLGINQVPFPSHATNQRLMLPQIYLNDGSVTEGSRGLGLRPTQLPTPDTGSDVAFLGGEVSGSDPRKVHDWV